MRQNEGSGIGAAKRKRPSIAAGPYHFTPPEEFACKF
jgi:hypothetical protein